MVSKKLPGQAGYGVKMMKSLSANASKKRMGKISRMKLHKVLIMGWLCYVRELSLSAKGVAIQNGSKKIREEDVEKAAEEMSQVFKQKND